MNSSGSPAFAKPPTRYMPPGDSIVQIERMTELKKMTIINFSLSIQEKPVSSQKNL
jgi:hypothetical protein